jgi:hypothetical protein
MPHFRRRNVAVGAQGIDEQLGEVFRVRNDYNKNTAVADLS